MKIKEIILGRLDDFEEEYKENVNWLSRFKNKTSPFEVYLSSNLFKKLCKEEYPNLIAEKLLAVSIDGFIVYNKIYPEINMDLVICIGNYPIGYNPKFYGLKE